MDCFWFLLKMIALPYVFVFAFGAVIGSFLNVVVLRYNTGGSVVAGGSKCLACAKKLRWHELIPVISFLAQKGRCRECFSKISWQYPIIETITGLLFLLVFSAIGWQFLMLIYFWAIFSLLIIIAVYDYYHQIIPDLFVYVFIGLSFLSLLFANWKLQIGNSNLIWSVAAGLILFAFFSSLWLFSKGTWMGFGDAKLALGIGWLLGLEKGIVATILAFLIGAVVGIFLTVLSRRHGGKYGMKSKIAFGPFLVLGTIIAFFAGDALVRIFLHNFAL